MIVPVIIPVDRPVRWKCLMTFFRFSEQLLFFLDFFFFFLKQQLLTLDETLSVLETKGPPVSSSLPFSGAGVFSVTEGTA